MLLTAVGVWEVVGNGIAVCLCGAGIYYLSMRRKAKKVNARERELIAANGAGDQTFNEMLVKLIKQSEKTFQTVAEALQKEREILQELVKDGTGSEKSSTKDVPYLVDASQKRKRSSTERRRKHGVFENKSENRYAEAAHLARMGRSEEEIAEKIRLPKGEVDLIVDISRMKEKSHHQG